MGEQVMNLLDGNNIPTLNIIFLLTIIALLPSIVVMVTSFTRIIIILSFCGMRWGFSQVPSQRGIGWFVAVSYSFYYGPNLKSD